MNVDEKVRQNIQSEIYKCTRCGKCRYYCPTFSVMKWDTYSPRGRLLLVDDYINNGELSQDLIDRLYSCSLCKLCEEICPSHVDTRSIVENMRSDLVNQEKAPYPEHIEMIKNILASGNVFNTKEKSEYIKSLTNENNQKSDTLFYLGCTGSYQYPKLANNWINILKKAGIDFTIQENELCCGGFLKTIGEFDRFKEIAIKNIETLKELGIKNIITACPMCYSAFKNDYPEIYGEKAFPFKVTNLYEIIDQSIQNKKINLLREIPLKTSYHDPCHLGRWSGIFDAPRNIIKSIPKIEFIELDKNKKEALCCGGPIRVPFFELRTGMSENIINNADKKGTEILVTSCPTCYHNLRASAMLYDIQVCEISELVAYSMGINNLEALDEIL